MSKLIIKFYFKGTKYFPIYDIVVMSIGNKVKGKFVEKLGYFMPLSYKVGNKEFVIDFFKLGYWLNRGAKLQKSVSKYFFGIK